MFRSGQPSPHVFVSKPTLCFEACRSSLQLEKEVKRLFLLLLLFNLELCKHHWKAIYILHLSLLLTGASAGRDVQRAAVIYDLAFTFDLCRVRTKQNLPLFQTLPTGNGNKSNFFFAKEISLSLPCRY